jgi:hypothetical protein
MVSAILWYRANSQPFVPLLFHISGRVLVEVASEIAGLLQALFDERLQAHLGARPLDGCDERIPTGAHLLVGSEASPIDQLRQTPSMIKAR